jgi:hypothetical protein
MQAQIALPAGNDAPSARQFGMGPELLVIVLLQPVLKLAKRVSRLAGSAVTKSYFDGAAS